MRSYWFLRRPDARGVYVAIWCRDRLLVVENSYRRERTLPGGGLHGGETPLQAAVRELREEVGIELAPEALKEAGVYVAHSEYTLEHAHFFEFEFREEPAITIDRREIVAAAFETPQRAVAQPLRKVVHLYLAARETAPS